MSEELEEQLVLHDAAALCGYALMRPAQIDPDEFMAIVGLDLERSALLAALAPALNTAWPGHPEPGEDLEAFLREAHQRIARRAKKVAGRAGYVPAALWSLTARELLLEYLQLDVNHLVGGVRSEAVWFAFTGTPDTEPMFELVSAGMLIKLRAVGAFLVLPPSSYKDELTAAQFFPAGEWEDIRDEAAAEGLLRLQPLIHKQVAHLTITRPWPTERDRYRPDSYDHLVRAVLSVLEDFSAKVDERLLLDGWSDWIAGLRPRLDPWPFEFEMPEPEPGA